MEQVNETNPNPLVLLQCKCPRCRKGNMFMERNPWKLKTTLKMNEACPVCHQPFNLEVGFYYGSSYVSYALTVAVSVASFIAWWLFVGFSLDDNRIFYWLTVNTLLLIFFQPYFMRVARTLWLSFFVRYNKDWRTVPPKAPERVNKAMENSW